MGIKYLNKFLQYNTNLECIEKKDLSAFENKIIAVDIYVYIFRFAKAKKLMFNIIEMICTFKRYNITPLIVFDGEAPKEKTLLLQNRKKDKNKAKSELKKMYDLNGNIKDDDIQKIIELENKSVNIKSEEIISIREIFKECNIFCIDAPGEADKLCAALVQKNIAWACLSDDTDLFVYGCPRVVRYFSMQECYAMLYNTELILKNLDLNKDVFRDICILYGTDYTTNYTDIMNTDTIIDESSDTNIMNGLSLLYQEYKKYVNLNNNCTHDDIINLLRNDKKCNPITTEELNNIRLIFDINNDTELLTAVDDIRNKLNNYEESLNLCPAIKYLNNITHCVLVT